MVAAALQAGSVHLAMFMVARVLNGIGAGILITNTPVYMSEVAPAHTRGLLVSAQGIAITAAYVVSSVAALGFHFVTHDYQWRLQFIVLTALALGLAVTMYFIPESPRWLMVGQLLLLTDKSLPGVRTTDKPISRGRYCTNYTEPKRTHLHDWHEQNMFKSKHRSKKKRYKWM
jgi:MFS family permease